MQAEMEKHTSSLSFSPSLSLPLPPSPTDLAARRQRLDNIIGAGRGEERRGERGERERGGEEGKGGEAGEREGRGMEGDGGEASVLPSLSPAFLPAPFAVSDSLEARRARIDAALDRVEAQERIDAWLHGLQ